MEILTDLFSHVCGQPIDRTWLPGGLALPVCQRCTGLYVGAALAAGLLLWLRPRMGPRFLQAHGACLLGMAPFGFHWIAHGPEIRTITGLLFGAAVVVFLALGPLEWLGASAGRRRGDRSPAAVSEEDSLVAAPAPPARAAARRYLLAFGIASAGLPLLARFGGRATAVVLTGGIVAGGLVFACLLALNMVLVAQRVLRVGRHRLTSVPT